MSDVAFEKYCRLKKGKYFSPEDAHIDGSETVLVRMGVSGITYSKSSVPCLGTAALDTCTGLALFNTKTKTVGVAHDFDLGANAFRELLSKVRTNDTDKIECHIIGATDQPNDTDLTKSQHGALDALSKAIESTPNVIITTFDVAAKPHPSAFVIDSRNGRLIRGTEDVSPGVKAEKEVFLYFDHKDTFFDGTSEEYAVRRKNTR
jgi:hypothetical protein